MTVNVWPAIVSVPVRAGPEFAATLNETTPLPPPDAAPEIVIQSGLFDEAVHVQPAPAVIATDPVAPGESTFCDVGLMLNAHGAAWLTVKVWPAIVSVPVRAAAPVLAATLNATEPFPLPDEPLVMVSQSGFAVLAVHVQPAAAVTPTLPVPPLAAIAWFAEARAGLQPLAWETVTVWPAIVNVPVRAAPPFTAALNATEPFPLPDVPLVIVSQSGFAELAVHVQPFEADTVTVAVPPAAPTAWLVDERVGLQPLACERVNVRPATDNVPVRAGPVFAANE
jgi:hypothetical protein